MTHVSWTRQLGLAIILFVLGLTAYWIEFKKKPESESIEEKSKKLFVLDGQSISTIRLSLGSHDRKDLVLSCLDLGSKLCKPGDQSKWQLAEPLRLRADDTHVTSLIATLNRLSASEVISLKEESPEKRASLLKEYGLDSEARKSARRVEVVAGQEKTTLYLGSAHPIGSNFFALESRSSSDPADSEKVDETRVFLVPNYVQSQLDHDLGYWRDKKLIAFAPHEIESFEYEGTHPKVHVQRQQGIWSLKVKNEEFPADPDVINAWLNSASGLSAKSFVSEQKTDPSAQKTLHGTKKVLVLTLNRAGEGDPKALTVTFFRDQKKTEPLPLYATVSHSDALFELDSHVFDRLDKNWTDLRLSRLITTLERFNTKKIEISGKSFAEKPIVLQQTNGKWTQEGQTQEVDSAKVQTLLDRLSGASIQEYLGSPRIPPGEAEGIRLKLSGEDKARELIFWKEQKGQGSHLFARQKDGKANEAFRLNPSLISSLPWDPRFFLITQPQTSASPQAGQASK